MVELYTPADAPMHGRHVIVSDVAEVTTSNIVEVLDEALNTHRVNQREIQKLYNYYRGVQPIFNREKDVREEITHNTVVNHANEIVEFKNGYLMGEPIQYVSRDDSAIRLKDINTLNNYVFAEEKASKDREIGEWMHICGTAFRMILADDPGEEDEAPFEIFTLDPRKTFVIYQNTIQKKPLLGVTYIKDQDNENHYYCYGANDYWEVFKGKVVNHTVSYYGDVPIIEYPLNNARLGSFEIVLDLLDGLNIIQSNRIEATEQFVQSLLLLHNVEMSTEQYDELRKRGAVKFRDVDPQMKGDIKYINAVLSQNDTQTLADALYDEILTITGMPNRQMGSTSTSDNGVAVLYRDGYTQAEGRAAATEQMFKLSERKFLKLLLAICNGRSEKINLKVSDVEIRFTRRNYENIQGKSQVLTTMLANEKIHPKLGFEYCGMFPDPDLAYEMSKKYYEEEQQKAQQQAQQIAEQRMVDNAESDTYGINDQSDDGHPGEGQ